MERIFGIDLGTTNSLIAIMDGAAPKVIRDTQSNAALLPSVVAVAPDGKVEVGAQAIEMEPHLTVEKGGQVSAVGFAGGEYGAVIRSVKRYMGLGSGEVASEVYETRRRRKDGTLVDVEVTWSALRDTTGAIVGTVVSVTDSLGDNQ